MIHTLKRALAAVCTLAALPAFAEVPVTDFTLDNGLQVVVLEDHRAPVVVQMLWYRAGSGEEDPGVSGVAHFLEHLLFKGTELLESGEFSATVSRHGGYDNAFTSNDYTGYFQRIAADRLELMMEMEASRVTGLKLGPEEIATERDVILEERNMRVENDPGSLFYEQMRAAQYLNHPYGVPVIGWAHEMEQLDLDDALAYYHRYYAPNNAILVVAGDVQPAEVRALAEKYYGPLPANRDLPVRERVSEPPQLAARRLVMEDPRVAEPYLMRTYLAPERDAGAQEKAAALRLLAELLGGGSTSLLVRELQMDQKIAVHASAYYNATALDDSVFTFYVMPLPGVSLEEAERALDKVLERFLAEGVDEDHLARIKRQIRAEAIYEQDDVGQLANRYGRALSSGLTIADVQAWPDVLEATTEKDIMTAAREVLVDRRSVTGWLTGLPEGAEEGDTR